MSDFDSNNPSDFEGDERGDLAWNEFDWEQYLREQDDVIHRYLAFYEHLRDHPERIDEVARCMQWDTGTWTTDAEDTDDDDEDDTTDFDTGPYTLHKNYIFVATKAIYLSLKRAWERIAEKPERVPQPLALAYQTSLHRGEENAMLAIQALDFGDYAMAISLFKRALAELNHTLSHLSVNPETASRALLAYRKDAMPRLFDLREIWLRMMRDCRQEIQRPSTDNDDDTDDE